MDLASANKMIAIIVASGAAVVAVVLGATWVTYKCVKSFLNNDRKDS